MAWPSKALEASDPEWLICVGRLVTSLLALLAIYLDPTQPAHFFQESEQVLLFYISYAVALVLLPKKRPLSSRFHMLTHTIDLVVLGGLAWLTDELTSPFFAFLPFILLATTMRWGMAGAVVGALVLELLLIAVGWPDIEDGESELNILIMRSAYFLVAAVMLGYIGATRDRSRERLAKLANWPFDPLTSEHSSWLRSLFRHAADVLGEPRLLAIWQDQERPSGAIAYWDKGQFALIPIDKAAFWAEHNLEDSPSGAIAEAGEQKQELTAFLKMIGPDPRYDRSQPRDIISANFCSLRYTGRLFVLDPGCPLQESISLTEIIATRIGYELERVALIGEIAEAARNHERARLGRDLHDSVLQDLAAASLKLKAAAQQVTETAAAELGLVGAILLDQQRRIRMFVENTRPAECQAESSLAEALRDCVQCLEDRWNCNVRFTIRPFDTQVPASLSSELCKLISEATANAVRHGKATVVEVLASSGPKGIELAISDNGEGIVETRKMNCSPLSIAGRVDDLGGVLTITRFSPGLSMLVQLPL